MKYTSESNREEPPQVQAASANQPNPGNPIRRSRNDGKGLLYDNKSGGGIEGEANSAGQSTTSIYKQEHVKAKFVKEKKDEPPARATPEKKLQKKLPSPSMKN